MTRKSIARRRPIIVYRVELTDDDRALVLKAWIGNDMGRLDPDRFLGTARDNEWDGGHLRGRWFDNRDTETIHGLPVKAREYLWEFDDALRA